MLKDYLKEHNISMYQLSKKGGVPYTTINDLVNGRVSVDNTKVAVLRGISKVLNLSMEEVYSMLEFSMEIEMEGLNKKANISVANKAYYVDFEYDGQKVKERVARVSEDNAKFLKTLATWTVEDYMDDKEFDRVSQEAFEKNVRSKEGSK